MAKNKHKTKPMECEESERNELRAYLTKALAFHEDYATAEIDRRNFWREKGIIFPPNKRITFDFTENELKKAFKGPAFEIWADKNRTGQTNRSFYKLDIKTPWPLKRLCSPEYLENIGLNSDFIERLEKKKSSQKQRRLVISIAMEDMIFSSDYAQYSSCHRTYMDDGPGDLRGGGRAYALMNNTGVVLLEEEELVPVNYHSAKRNGGSNNKFPFLPKKIGRRLMVGGCLGAYKDNRLFETDINSVSFWYEYGMLNLALVPIMSYFLEKGCFPIASMNTHVMRSLISGMEYYADGCDDESDLVTLPQVILKTKHKHPPYWSIDGNEDDTWCTNCGENAVDTEGDYCEECIEECFVCDYRQGIGEFTSHNERLYCSTCFDEEFFRCDDCSTIHPLNEIITYLASTYCSNCASICSNCNISLRYSYMSICTECIKKEKSKTKRNDLLWANNILDDYTNNRHQARQFEGPINDCTCNSCTNMESVRKRIIERFAIDPIVPVDNRPGTFMYTRTRNLAEKLFTIIENKYKEKRE